MMYHPQILADGEAIYSHRMYMAEEVTYETHHESFMCLAVACGMLLPLSSCLSKMGQSTMVKAPSTWDLQHNVGSTYKHWPVHLIKICFFLSI